MWGGYCPGSSRPHTPPTTGAKAVELSPAFLRAMRASPHMHPEGKRKLFPSLVYPTLSLICAREQKDRGSASSLRNSTNWLQRDFQTRLMFFLRKWKTLPRRAAKASSKRRACFVLFRCLAFVCAEHRFINVSFIHQILYISVPAFRFGFISTGNVCYIWY